MNKLFKRTIAGLVGVGAIGGATAAAVSCGASQKIYDFKVYSYEFKSDPISVGMDGKDLRVWFPFKYPDEKNAYYKLGQAVIKVLTDAGFNVDPKSIVADATTDYSSAGETFSRYASSDRKLLPDVVINYPDLQALFVEKGLGQPFDMALAKQRISDALQFDITSVLSSDKQAYALPISKSSELSYFNVPAFAMVLYDISLQKDLVANESVTFPANSAQQRMLDMITFAWGSNSNVQTGIYTPVDSDWKDYWSNIKMYWENLTKSGGIWEKDEALLRKNFKLVDKTKLLDINWSDRMFETYSGIASYAKILKQAYSFDASNHDTAILGIDSSANVVYAYQYDAACHSADNFIIKASDNPPRLEFDYRDKVTDGTGASATTSFTPTYQAFKYLSDLQNSGAIFVRDLNAPSSIYTTDFVKQHKMFIGWRSSSGVSAATADAKDKPENLNPGEVYFDYQPTKAGVSEEVDRKTIINQGPSIFVSKVHKNSAEIAAAILDGFKPGGAFTANIKDGKDEGMFSSVGYIYADASDYQVDSAYLKTIKEAINSSDNWAGNIGKYLVSQHFINATSTPAKFDAFANAAGRGTSSARNAIDQAFLVAFRNNAQIQAADAMQSVLRFIVPDSRLV